jgi:CheY-like chemotaxis protein
MRPMTKCFLIVENSPEDQTLMLTALRRNGVADKINCVASGNEAVAYLKGDGGFADRARFPFPTIILMDLRMPEGDDLSVLESIKRHPVWSVIPTIVFSGSSDTDDIKKSYMLGASSYLVKPDSFAGYRRLFAIMYEYWQECEVPEIDEAGQMVETNSRGKVGERFPQPKRE